MKLWLLILASLPVLVARMAIAQLQLAPSQSVQELKFMNGGELSPIPVTLRSVSDAAITTPVQIRVFQASSATVVERSTVPWKTIRVLPGQTILETARVNFPVVRAKTKFLVQWIEGTNRVIGTMEVWVYPTNLLHELKPLFDDDKPVGVFDPQNELTPALHSAGVHFEDLGETVLDAFRGRLAIVGPFDSSRQMSDGLAGRIKALANRGVPVVWIVPTPEDRDAIAPSFYTVAEDASCVVVAQRPLVKDFPENPQSQLNLIHFCKVALEHRPMALPCFVTEP